jgi:hypothetical protein
MGAAYNLALVIPRSGSPRLSDRWFAKPWVIIFFAAVVGVPGVFLGLSLFALVVTFLVFNPVTWFLAGAFWFAAGFRHYQHRLTIRDTPMSKIDAAAIGLVEISGRVVSQAVDTAPLSGKPSVYWEVVAKVHGEDRTSTILEKRSALCFDVEDSSGRVLVWPWDSELIVTDSQQWEGPAAVELAGSLPEGSICDVLRRHAAGSGRLAVTERKIGTGKTVYVMGTLSERRSVVKPQALWDKVQGRFRRTPQATVGAQPDFSGVAAIKMFAWAIAMVIVMLATGEFSAFGTSSKPTEEPPDVDPHKVLIWRGQRDRPFIIADTPEAMVVNTLTKWTKLSLLGGAATMVGTMILYLGGFFS